MTDCDSQPKCVSCVMGDGQSRLRALGTGSSRNGSLPLLYYGGDTPGAFSAQVLKENKDSMALVPRRIIDYLNHEGAYKVVEGIKSTLTLNGIPQVVSR